MKKPVKAFINAAGVASMNMAVTTDETTIEVNTDKPRWNYSLLSIIRSNNAKTKARKQFLYDSCCISFQVCLCF